MRQLLAESVAIALVSGLLSAAAAVWGTGLLRAALSGDWWRFFFVGVDKIGVSTDVLAFSLTISLASVFLFSLLPAVRASRVDPNADLKQGRQATSGRGPRGTLVVVEMVLSIVLVTGAMLSAQAAMSVGVVDLGLSQDVATFTIRTRNAAYDDPVSLRRLVQDVLSLVRATPGVAAAATSSRMPGISPGRGVSVEPDDTDGELAEATVQVVSDAYFGTLGIPLVSGREFTGGDRADAAPVAVVGETVAERLWPGGSAVGRRIRLGNDEGWLTVVGVADDVARAWNDRSPMLAVYVPAAQRPATHMAFLMQAEPGAAELARRRVWERYPDVPLPASESIEAALAEQAAPARMASALMAAFAVVAMVICLGGIHGFVSYVATLRVREVGVHIAVGADRAAVVRLFVGRGVRLAGVGLLIGLPAGYLFASVLERSMRRFSPSIAVDGASFVLLGAALLALTALASYLPARRAAAIDPSTVLRAE